MTTIPMSTGILSNAMEKMILLHVFKNASTAGSVAYMAFYTTNPTDSDVGTEVSSASYARENVMGKWDVSTTSGCAWNKNTILFNSASLPGWSFSYFGVKNGSATGGNSGCMLFYGYVRDGDIFRNLYLQEYVSFLPGSIGVSITGCMSPYLAGKLLDHYLNNNNFATPGSAIYAGLFWNPSSWNGKYTTSGSEELSGSIGYCRIPCGGAGSWVSPGVTGGSTRNAGHITFVQSSPCPLYVNGVTLYSAGSGGEKLFQEYLAKPKYVELSAGFRISASQLKVVLD